MRLNCAHELEIAKAAVATTLLQSDWDEFRQQSTDLLHNHRPKRHLDYQKWYCYEKKTPASQRRECRHQAWKYIRYTNTVLLVALVHRRKQEVHEFQSLCTQLPATWPAPNEGPLLLNRARMLKLLNAVDEIFRKRRSLITSCVPGIGRLNRRRLQRYLVNQSCPTIFITISDRARDFNLRPSRSVSIVAFIFHK